MEGPSNGTKSSQRHLVGMFPASSLNDIDRRALNLLADHPDGCDEAVLIAEGLHVGQLAVLVVEGLATMQRRPAHVSGRDRKAVWMQITEAGRKAIAE
jgi:hypothetical protein